MVKENKYIPTVDVAGSGLTNLIIMLLKSMNSSTCMLLITSMQAIDPWKSICKVHRYVSLKRDLAVYIHRSVHSPKLTITLHSCRRLELKAANRPCNFFEITFDMQLNVVLFWKIKLLIPVHRQRNLAMCDGDRKAMRLFVVHNLLLY